MFILNKGIKKHALVESYILPKLQLDENLIQCVNSTFLASSVFDENRFPTSNYHSLIIYHKLNIYVSTKLNRMYS